MSRSSSRRAWSRWAGSPAVSETPLRLASTSAGRCRRGVAAYALDPAAAARLWQVSVDTLAG